MVREQKAVPENFGGPKKNKNSFQLFQDSVRAKVMEEMKAAGHTAGRNGTLMGEVGRKMGAMWKDISAEDKKKKRERMDPILAREMNRRQDWDKWAEGLEGKDQRLQDGFHRVGDTWGDSAFADLSKVKGKSFVKEMQKKKRASWRGGGKIDMAVNSLLFSDSE